MHLRVILLQLNIQYILTVMACLEITFLQTGWLNDSLDKYATNAGNLTLRNYAQ